MGQQFDDLAKALASGTSRRRALKAFLGGVVGTVFAFALPKKAEAANQALCAITVPLCREWCIRRLGGTATRPSAAAAACIAKANTCRGACYTTPGAPGLECALRNCAICFRTNNGNYQAFCMNTSLPI
jgi:hypothetical protein